MLRIEYRLGLTQKYPLLWMQIELSHKERLLKPCLGNYVIMDGIRQIVTK